DLIHVSYKSADPDTAARVLNTLSDVYLEKHLAVHRLSGTYEFFQHSAEQYRDQLMQAQSQLTRFDKTEGVAAPEVEKEIDVRKLAEFEASLQGTQADIMATEERIRTLEERARLTQPRTTTTVKKAVGQHSEQLPLTLVNLELKRIELVRIYEPTYPLVVDV